MTLNPQLSHTLVPSLEIRVDGSLFLRSKLIDHSTIQSLELFLKVANEGTKYVNLKEVLLGQLGNESFIILRDVLCISTLLPLIFINLHFLEIKVQTLRGSGLLSSLFTWTVLPAPGPPASHPPCQNSCCPSAYLCDESLECFLAFACDASPFQMLPSPFQACQNPCGRALSSQTSPPSSQLE